MYKLIFVLLIVMIGLSGCVNIPDEHGVNESVTITVQPTIVKDDMTILSEQIFADMSCRDFYYTYGSSYSCANYQAQKDDTLYNMTYENAKEGIHSLSLEGTNVQEAYEVFDLYDVCKFDEYCSGYGRTRMIFGSYNSLTKYGYAIYHNEKLHRYNVSITFRVTPPVELVKNSDGSYGQRQSSSRLEYMW